MFGVQIVFKSGENDWVDPCENDPEEADGNLVVANTGGEYEYKLDSVDKWFRYELCEKCGHDLRDYDCEPGKCVNN